MIRIGIIGNIGSGKSYVAQNFGYPVFNADYEVAQLYQRDKKIFTKLKKSLPKYIQSFPIKKKEVSNAILANKNKLIQVFINLIENSLSLSSKKSKILIKLSKIDNSKVAIKVYDQGRGVDSKDSEKIFERFYSDRQENIKNHTGLGLSIAREIIEHMHGSISLDKSDKSDYPGACFLITLPIKQ